MNTIFTRELEKICKDMDMLYDCRFAGNVFMGRLTDETIAKIFFDTGIVRDEYERIHMKVINTRLGEVNSQSVFVADVFSKASKRNAPYIYRPRDFPDDQCGWRNYNPTPQDYKNLRAEIYSYLEMFAEPVQEMKMGM